MFKVFFLGAGMLALFTALRNDQGETSNRSDDPSLRAPFPFGLLVFSLILTAFAFPFRLWPYALFTWLCVALPAFAYYSSLVRLQATPVGSSFSFFLISLFLFAHGFLCGAARLDINAFLFGIYFALVLAGAELVGQVVAHGFFGQKELGPNIETFGARTVFSFSFSVFGFSFIYLLMLAAAGTGAFRLLLPFLLAFPAQILLFLVLGGYRRKTDIVAYQTGYRFLYFTTAGVFAFLRIFM